jgi:uncharacterized protein (TIGR02145 family)
MNSKGVQGDVNMNYTTNEILKYTAVSGNNCTVMTDIPTADKTVTFNFTECKDGDNNYYPVVQINTQLWMAENLKTTIYNDGSAIPFVTDKAGWAALTTPGYCWYSYNEASYKATYGALYNWYALDATNNGGKNVCPTGWHVPSDDDGTTLTTYLGGISVAGGKLKETGTAHWIVPNTGATNETGFTALPGGAHDNDGSFYGIGDSGLWWSATEYNATHARYQLIYYGTTGVYRDTNFKKYGSSIRCLRD